MTLTLSTTTLAAALTLTAGFLVIPSVSQAEMTAGKTSCSQLRQDYPKGVAKTKKAANRVVKQGYQRPIVCKRLFLKVNRTLDPNRNRVVCETR